MAKRQTELTLEQMAIKHAGLGVAPRRLSDYGSQWPKVSALPGEWVDLLEQIDKTKEPRLLLPYLLPNVPPEVRPHLEDMFVRLAFKSRSRRTPSYTISEPAQQLLWAESCVRDFGYTEEEAAKTCGVDPEALAKALLGKHTSFRRATRGMRSRSRSK